MIKIDEDDHDVTAINYAIRNSLYMSKDDLVEVCGKCIALRKQFDAALGELYAAIQRKSG